MEFNIQSSHLFRSTPPLSLALSKVSARRCMVSVDAARTKSEEEWIHDLGELRINAEKWFSDVSWIAEGSQKVVYAHKCIVYARATGRYLSRPPSTAF